MSNNDVNIFDDVVSSAQPIEILLALLSTWLIIGIIMAVVRVFYFQERQGEEPQNAFLKTTWTIASPIYLAIESLIIYCLRLIGITWKDDAS